MQHPSRTHARTCAILALATALGLAPAVSVRPARAAPPTSEETPAAQAFVRFQEGERLFKAARYDDAAAAFEAAWSLFADPAYCFNAGWANEKAHHWNRAIGWYTRLLATYPDSANRAEVEAHLQTVRRLQTTDPEEDPTHVVPDPHPALDPIDHTGSWVAWGVGGAALVTGAVLGGVALGSYDDARTLAAQGPLADADWRRFKGLQTDVRGESAGADICFGVALAGAVIGTVLWFSAGPASGPDGHGAPGSAPSSRGPGGAAWSF